MKLLHLLLLSATCLFMVNHSTAQLADTLHVKKIRNDKTTSIPKGQQLKIALSSGATVKGSFQGLDDSNLVLGNDSFAIADMVWLRRRTAWRPIGITLATGGTGMFLFGMAGFLSSVGSDEPWVQLGAVIGALIAVTGGIIDLAAWPMLARGRTFRLSGKRAKWVLESN